MRNTFTDESNVNSAENQAGPDISNLHKYEQASVLNQAGYDINKSAEIMGATEEKVLEYLIYAVDKRLKVSYKSLLDDEKKTIIAQVINKNTDGRYKTMKDQLPEIYTYFDIKDVLLDLKANK